MLNRFALVVTVCLLSGGALGDITPPQVSDAYQRLQAHPGTFDRTDQFCTDRLPGNACSIAGTVFEGGGTGICKQDIDRATGNIDLTCALSQNVEFVRDLPEHPYRADAYTCSAGPRYEGSYEAFKLAVGHWVCNELPFVSDRSCGARKAGDRCSVLVVVGSAEPKVYDGVCREALDRQNTYYHGRRWLERTVFSCQPERPVVRELRSIGLRERIRQ